MNQKPGLTGPQELAVVLVAEDAKTDEEIARDVGISRPTLRRWKMRPEFQDAIKAATDAYAQRILSTGIARRENRVKALHSRWLKMQQVIDERAADPTMQNIPGGKTGVIIRQLKQIGSGRDAEMVEEYAVDTGTLKELRAHEQQAAQEVGQWLDKADLTSGGEPFSFTMILDGKVHGGLKGEAE